uniref:Uncharacterized protein n=1 Tax=Opuntia streptacantha TaxID=393608 RepID=A0A7C8YJ31_OPUST
MFFAFMSWHLSQHGPTHTFEDGGGGGGVGGAGASGGVGGAGAGALAGEVPESLASLKLLVLSRKKKSNGEKKARLESHNFRQKRTQSGECAVYLVIELS